MERHRLRIGVVWCPGKAYKLAAAEGHVGEAEKRACLLTTPPDFTRDLRAEKVSVHVGAAMGPVGARWLCHIGSRNRFRVRRDPRTRPVQRASAWNGLHHRLGKLLHCRWVNRPAGCRASGSEDLTDFLDYGFGEATGC